MCLPVTPQKKTPARASLGSQYINCFCFCALLSVKTFHESPRRRPNNEQSRCPRGGRDLRYLAWRFHAILATIAGSKQINMDSAIHTAVTIGSFSHDSYDA